MVCRVRGGGGEGERKREGVCVGGVMRIRKRTSQSVAPASTHVTPPPPQPILFKYHQATSNTAGGSPGRDSSARFRGSKAAAECSNMQENRSCLEDGDDHEAPASPQSSSDVYAEPPVRTTTLLFVQG